MNFYKHHIGDFDADTAHLSWMEDAAYRRLMCLYYRREAPIPSDVDQACRLVRATSKQERDAVRTVLAEFFTDEDDGWHNKRCDMEIEAAQAKAARNREVGKTGGRPRKPETQTVAKQEPTENPDGFQNRTQTEPNQNPSQTPDSREIQIHPPTPRKRGSVHDFPPGFEEFWSAYPRKTAKAAAAKAFARTRPDEATLRLMLTAIARQRESEQWRRDGGQFIPHASSWINGRRWEDESLPSTATSSVFEGAA